MSSSIFIRDTAPNILNSSSPSLYDNAICALPPAAVGRRLSQSRRHRIDVDASSDVAGRTDANNVILWFPVISLDAAQ